MRVRFFAALVVAFVAVVARSMSAAPAPNGGFVYEADRFADIEVLRYQVPGFERLSLNQKKLAYFLYEAGLSGRDIFWDQKNRHNLTVRKTLEGLLTSYRGEKRGASWDAFRTYAKQVFFANGIHHHSSNAKFEPAFSAEYFATLLRQSDPAALPLAGKSVDALLHALTPVLFDPAVDAKTVNLDPNRDIIRSSANNFYRDVTAAEVEAFYAEKARTAPDPRISFGLNSQLAKVDGKVVERVWKVGGMYGPALERVVGWLERAATVAETPKQKESIEHLIRYYRTGDLAEFDRYNIAWVADTTPRIDFVNGFIEVYQDAAQKRGAYESVVSMRDEEATKRIAAISREAQWFEDHSPILPKNKKANVTGISAKVITVISEAGDSAPATPIGINLPNAEWIREQHGSKSVSLGNINEAYNTVKAKSPLNDEFAENPAALARMKKWGPLANDLHTDMHEVIGHASGQLNPGIAPPDQTLKAYAGILEEARADLVGLYYAIDPKLVEIGVMPTIDVGKAEYDSYLMNGLMTQLYRIKPGEQLEEAHMRNRQLVASWVLEKGRDAKVVERVRRDGKTYVRINDYEALRKLFGDLLREIQRIKSEGDFEAGKALVENYGVKVEAALRDEVHRRYEKLNVAPYSGFIQPKLVAVRKGDEIVDVKIEYPTDFLDQMLEYGRDYAFLPLVN